MKLAYYKKIEFFILQKKIDEHLWVPSMEIIDGNKIPN